MSPDPTTEQRLREVETIGTIVQTSMKAMHQDISDLKNMFSKVISDSVKIAELQAKVRTVDALYTRVENLAIVVGNLNTELITIKSKHDVCMLGRGEEAKVLRDMREKISSVESNNIGVGNALNRLESSIDRLEASKGKVEGVIWKWIERIGWLIVLSVLTMVFKSAEIKTDFTHSSNLQNPKQNYSQNSNN